MLEERQNCLSILYIENVTAKQLSFEEAIKEYAAIKSGEKSITEVCQKLINKNTMLFFYFVVFVVSVSFFKFLIRCDFFSHSK